MSSMKRYAEGMNEGDSLELSKKPLSTSGVSLGFQGGLFDPLEGGGHSGNVFPLKEEIQKAATEVASIVSNKKYEFKHLGFSSYSLKLEEKGDKIKIKEVRFTCPRGKFIIVLKNYDLSIKSYDYTGIGGGNFSTVTITNLTNDGIFPKVRNGYGQRVIKISGEYIQDLDNFFAPAGLQKFLIELLKNFHINDFYQRN